MTRVNTTYITQVVPARAPGGARFVQQYAVSRFNPQISQHHAGTQRPAAVFGSRPLRLRRCQRTRRRADRRTADDSLPRRIYGRGTDTRGGRPTGNTYRSHDIALALEHPMSMSLAGVLRALFENRSEVPGDDRHAQRVFDLVVRAWRPCEAASGYFSFTCFDSTSTSSTIP